MSLILIFHRNHGLYIVDNPTIYLICTIIIHDFQLLCQTFNISVKIEGGGDAAIPSWHAKYFPSISHDQIKKACMYTRKTLNLFPVDENRLQQCCAAPHEQCCQQHVATLFSITRCNNIVDNNVHGVQHNIAEAGSHQPGTTCAFLAVQACSWVFL